MRPTGARGAQASGARPGGNGTLAGAFQGGRTLGIPVFIVNARLSDRALAGRCRFKGLLGKALKDAHVAAQNEEHGARFKLLGAYPGRVRVLGNLKYDLAPPGISKTPARPSRRSCPEGPLWVAGSVREGEEDLVLAAHCEVRKTLPSARLLLAPRHLNRAALCVDLARTRGLTAARRTQNPGRDWDVLVLDTVGELWSAYDLGRVAFVGGSLVPLGGQNVLEPAFLGKPVLYGPAHSELSRGDGTPLRFRRRIQSGESRRIGMAGCGFFGHELGPGLRPEGAPGCRTSPGLRGRVARWLTDALPAP